VTGVLQKNIQHIGGLHLQGSGVFAGVAAEEILLLGLTIHHKLNFVLGVKEGGTYPGFVGALAAV